MSRLADIREQVKTILADVPDIGVIHDYERFHNDWGKFLALFQDTRGRINGCMYAREKAPSRQATMGEEERAHIIVIRRFMALRDADATGILFEESNEAVLDAFGTAEAATLSGACLTIHPDWGPMAGAAGAQLEITENRMFGNTLCHYAEIRLCAIERIEK